MIDTAVYFGADQATAEAEMKKVLDFELELAKASAPKEERRDAEALYNPFTIDNLETLEGHPPNWKDYLQNIIKVDLEDDEKVVVSNPKYLHDYADIVAKTDNVVLVNYLMFKAASETLGVLDEKAREIPHAYAKATSGVKKQQPIWRTCVNRAGFNSRNPNLSIASASMYLNRHFKLEAKHQMDKMAENVREALRRKIEDATWMDDETRDVAREKLKNMRQTVGYPEEILDEEKVSAFYEGLELTAGDFFGSTFALDK